MSQDKKDQHLEELIDKTFQYVLDELRGESERACAIVGPAFLDDLLGILLEKYILENKDSYHELLSPDNTNSPLGNFGSRIIICYAIGLLNKDQLKAIRAIKKLEIDLRMI